MSAFQSYAGAYEFGDENYRWRCYATTQIFQVRRPCHAARARPPLGQKWVQMAWRPCEEELLWLIGEDADEFSQILLQIEPARAAVHFPRAKEATS